VLLFVSYSGTLGGAERLLIGWALAVDGERVLACPEGPLADAARENGIRVLELRERSLELRRGARGRALALARLAAHRRELRALVASLDPDVVVLAGMRSAIAGLAIGSLGDGSPASVFQQSDLLPGPAIGRLVRRAARRSDLTLALSEAVAADLDPQGALGDRVRVVHPGIDAARFDAGARPAEPAEVLVLGAIAPSKRPDVALEAFALARRDDPGLRLRIAGAPLTDSDERLAAKLRGRASRPDLAGSVELLGAVGDPRAELERATVLLHCAPREAFGMAVLEALAAGRPAVVPDSGGPREIVDAASGILYPPGDAQAAAAALARLTADPELAARMGRAGSARAREDFDLQTARRRWAAAVEGIRPRPRPTAAAAAAKPGELEIVTVTHNSAAELGALLASVERHLPGTRVVVVDSASSDATLEVARASEATLVIALDRNVGFGAATNLGLREVRAPVAALLNPDVELLDDSLLDPVGELLRTGAPDRLLAPLALNSDGSRQDTVHAEPGSAADLAIAIVSPAVLPRAAAAALAPWMSAAARPVGWAVGCALLARTETLRGLGPFDEALFMYGEDLDLCLRAGRDGIETWFWPTARVIHHRAHASAKAFGGEPYELLARARHEVVERRLGRGRASVDDGAQALTFATRIAVKRVLGRPAARERRQLRALLSVRRDG
jgi:GT2 family glycosyltransferase/glycosyltransferase involved in cell wall biosynthesis